MLAWGVNSRGELGDGSTLNSDVPVKVKLPRHTRVTAISAGAHFSLAATAGRRALAWGENIAGQLGDGSTVDRDRPVKVKLPLRAKVTALAGGGNHTLALTSAGLFSWGDNIDGQLGNGTPGARDTPVKVKLPHGTRVRAVSASCVDSFALTATGRVLAWGGNIEGILGNGTFTTGSPIPVRVDLPAGWRASALGVGPDADHALALVHRVHS